MLMFLSICLNSLANFVVSFSVYVSSYYLLFVLLFIICIIIYYFIINCFIICTFFLSFYSSDYVLFLFCVYTIICLLFCYGNRSPVQFFVYVVIHFYNYLLLWVDFYVCIH
jgi:hypothetical protein